MKREFPIFNFANKGILKIKTTTTTTKTRLSTSRDSQPWPHKTVTLSADRTPVPGPPRDADQLAEVDQHSDVSKSSPRGSIVQPGSKTIIVSWKKGHFKTKKVRL